MADIFDKVAAQPAAKPNGDGDEPGWIGVDLDGTLAHYDGFKGKGIVGAPIKPMVDRVKKWLADGKDVRIFTAQVANDPDGTAKKGIDEWCQKNIGQVLPVTNVKDEHMISLYDDRAVQVEENTGKIIGKEPDEDDSSNGKFHPSTHQFSVSKWKQANPDGDHEAAKKQASDAGFDVTD